MAKQTTGASKVMRLEIRIQIFIALQPLVALIAGTLI
jgi:hypothetical protein